jgi:hypothetical protein
MTRAALLLFLVVGCAQWRAGDRPTARCGGDSAEVTVRHNGVEKTARIAVADPWRIEERDIGEMAVESYRATNPTRVTNER